MGTVRSLLGYQCRQDLSVSESCAENPPHSAQNICIWTHFSWAILWTICPKNTLWHYAQTLKRHLFGPDLCTVSAKRDLVTHKWDWIIYRSKGKSKLLLSLLKVYQKAKECQISFGFSQRDPSKTQRCLLKLRVPLMAGSLESFTNWAYCFLWTPGQEIRVWVLLDWKLPG